MTMRWRSCALFWKENGFRVTAGGAFVGRHAFTDALAEGRPDENDVQEMLSFAAAIADKVKHLPEEFGQFSVPGDASAPYYVPRGIDGQPARFLKAVPQTNPAGAAPAADSAPGCVPWAPLTRRMCSASPAPASNAMPAWADAPHRQNILTIPLFCLTLPCWNRILRNRKGTRYFYNQAQMLPCVSAGNMI